ncbi:MAG: DUF3501 domain-containing protein [Nitrospiraceae bacterium]
MKPLTKEDLIPYAEYERIRDSFRRRIIQLKERRRISLGDRVALLFENRDTIQFQVQEMIRVERIFDPAKIQDELDVYNKLIPGKGQLSATLFIEITDSERIKQDLDAFQGIDRGNVVAIQAGRHRIYAEFEGSHSKEDKISAVHFVTFRPTVDFIRALSDPDSRISILINHPAYQVETDVPEDMRQEWLSDLRSSEVEQVGHPSGGAG